MRQLCAANEITEEQSKSFEIDGRGVFAVRKNNALYVYENRCPHRGVPLEWMPDTFLEPQKQFIQCATHGALFVIDSGLCIAGPCNGVSLEPVEFDIIDGQLCIPPL
ncbi:Rieske (2Fe-2S) protein [Aliamphritea ceti]|uniref:Rieske (2Fe-2S) protein n=1 Tax=Aliamphritea ceti TaxID=1524258 RepID=UPI0021C2A062|nr:Rieske 2Fe-2S domain-containing protein [Aliamphritea ceti]